MMAYKAIQLLTIALFLNSHLVNAQQEEDPFGGWYTYNFNTNFGASRWGLDGEVQYTNYSVKNDLNWFLVRTGITYKPKNTTVKLALGYGNATFGEIGPDNATITENRIYQQLNLPLQIASLKFLHRFRYEQRFFNGFFRSRWRYGLYLNLPLNNKILQAKTLYLALYNELFINGEREFANGIEVPYFDQNRTYIAFGYAFTTNFKMQLGLMRLIRSNDDRMTLQVSLHHKF